MKTAHPSKAEADGPYKPIIAFYGCTCPLCGFEIAPWSQFDFSIWCTSCGGFVPLPETQLAAPPLTEKQWQRWQSAPQRPQAKRPTPARTAPHGRTARGGVPV